MPGAAISDIIFTRNSSKDILETNYISQLSDGTNTYIVKDTEARTSLSNKQDTLVSGTNIKTINNTSILGSGNIEVGGSSPTWSYNSTTRTLTIS